MQVIIAKMARRALQAAFAALLLSAASSAWADGEVNVDADGVALKGYDPVAYFTDGKPVMGSADFVATRGTATYRFASAEHRDMFLASPDKFTPQFGGYCSYGTTLSKKVDIDPMQFSIAGGKLYVNSGAQAQSLWLKDEPANITKAKDAWMQIEHKAPGEL
jgi:YHS domain-containing protein